MEIISTNIKLRPVDTKHSTINPITHINKYEVDFKFNNTQSSLYLNSNKQLLKLNQTKFDRKKITVSPLATYRGGNGASVSFKDSKKKEVLMVDPLTAKEIAKEDMKNRERAAEFQRKRKIEAINGGWAMIGLTAGLIMEYYTREGIISQLATYLDVVADELHKLAN